jgi:hypothetical protein
MASLYTVGLNKAGVNTANTVMWQLKTAAADRMHIRELGIFVNTAPTTAPLFALARSTALGTATTSVLGQAMDNGDPAATGLAESAWSSAPTFATGGPFLRLAGLPVTAGSGLIWTFAYGECIVVPVSAGLCIANINASGATLGNFVFYVSWTE